MNKILEAHRFFCRKSQHYVMGNWNNYETWFMYKLDDCGFSTGEYLGFNWSKFRYTYYFPFAYVKFMYYELFN